MFKEPQLSLLQLNVTNIAFSTWWVNFPPLITSTQVQQAWSRLHGANLLASGNNSCLVVHFDSPVWHDLSFPAYEGIGLSWYNSGSGIYSYNSTLTTLYNPTHEPMEKMLIATVPKALPREHSLVPVHETEAIPHQNEKILMDDLTHMFKFKRQNADKFSQQTFEAIPGTSGNNISILMGRDSYILYYSFFLPSCHFSELVNHPGTLSIGSGTNGFVCSANYTLAPGDVSSQTYGNILENGQMTVCKYQTCPKASFGCF